MSTWNGTVKKSPLEGGIWELHDDQGKRYQLQTKDPQLLVESQRVVITGTLDQGAFGIGMTGPTLIVSSWKPAPS